MFNIIRLAPRVYVRAEVKAENWGALSRGFNHKLDCRINCCTGRYCHRFRAPAKIAAWMKGIEYRKQLEAGSMIVRSDDMQLIPADYKDVKVWPLHKYGEGLPNPWIKNAGTFEQYKLDYDRPKSGPFEKYDFVTLKQEFDNGPEWGAAGQIISLSNFGNISLAYTQFFSFGAFQVAADNLELTY